MTIQEILKAQGLNDEQINKITTSMKENKIYTTSLENVDVRYDKLQEQKKQLEEASKVYEKQLKELSKNNTDNEELKKQLEQLQLSNKELEEKHLNEMNKLQFDFALDGALSTAKCKNSKALKALLNLDEVKYQDGKLEGLETQLEVLKKEASYLFEAEQQTPSGSGFNPPGEGAESKDGFNFNFTKIR
ncbi:phage scaffolding protein [Terrisporobacter othiniensis]|uniref:phage scaffolding protein n=1 Tax=Terrisporobacter othiniensis TaxID=1577792 RepID=UPI00068F2B69|nr:phage scaffolding protein [Terrisporobacter othiniensis]